MTSSRNTIAIALAAVALAFATAPAFAAPDLQEDDPGWSCVDSGNRICGPDSDDWGHTPGCYDDAGTLVASWPCYIVIDANGDADVYTPEVAHGVAAVDGGAPGPGTGPVADANDDALYARGYAN